MNALFSRQQKFVPYWNKLTRQKKKLNKPQHSKQTVNRLLPVFPESIGNIFGAACPHLLLVNVPCLSRKHL